MQVNDGRHYGRHAHVEQPLHALSWKTSALKRLPGHRACFDQCALGVLVWMLMEFGDWLRNPPAFSRGNELHCSTSLADAPRTTLIVTWRVVHLVSVDTPPT